MGAFWRAISSTVKVSPCWRAGEPPGSARERSAEPQVRTRPGLFHSHGARWGERRAPEPADPPPSSRPRARVAATLGTSPSGGCKARGRSAAAADTAALPSQLSESLPVERSRPGPGRVRVATTRPQPPPSSTHPTPPAAAGGALPFRPLTEIRAGRGGRARGGVGPRAGRLDGRGKGGRPAAPAGCEACGVCAERGGGREEPGGRAEE